MALSTVSGGIICSTHVEIAKAVRVGNLRSVLVAGPRGVGKTTLGFQIAKGLKYDIKLTQKVQFHAEASPAEILGMWVPDGDKFRWEAGPLDICYGGGGFLILDEIVEASGPCKTLLYGALDDGPGGVISYVGRTFRPTDKYKVFATMNGWPLEGGLPEPLLDRFDAVFIVTQPSVQQLSKLDEDLRQMCIQMYASATDPMRGPDLTYRVFQSLQKLRKALPIDQAVIASCYGDQKLAGSLLEGIAIRSGEAEDEDLEDEDDVDDEDIDDEDDEDEDNDEDDEDEDEDEDEEEDD